MKKSTRKIVIASVIILCVAGLALYGYYRLNKSDAFQKKSSKPPSTEAGKLMEKDLEDKYPGTPTEVLKLYWRFNKCMYNTSMKDEYFEGLLKQLRMLYDDELLAEEENSWDNMLDYFHEEVNAFTKAERFISSYTVDKNSSVKYGKVDGKECATIMSSVFESAKSKHTVVYEKFLCRQDASGKWKILGWEKTNEETTQD